MQISPELKENSQRQCNETEREKKEILHFLAVYHLLPFFAASNSLRDRPVTRICWLTFFKPPTQASVLVPVVVVLVVRAVIQIFMNTLSLCLHTTLNDFSSFVISWARKKTTKRKKMFLYLIHPISVALALVIFECVVWNRLSLPLVRNERVQNLNYLIVDCTLHWLKMDDLRF